MADSPVSHHSPESNEQEDANSNQRAQMEQAYQQMQRKMRMSKMSEGIRHKIMVLSGKGGVGKTTVATGIALSLARMGKKVGLMDIDITGPNVPKMLGIEGTELHIEDGQIFPAIGPHGIKVISMAFLIEDPDKPVIWRGPIKLGAIQQFIGDVAWGELDTLVIDFPPGTGDEPLTVSQTLPNLDGVVIVTTPQEVALLDSRKSINFAKTISVPVLGVVENMSGYNLSGNAEAGAKFSLMGPTGVPIEVTASQDGKWSVNLDLFKSGGGEESAVELEVPFLGRLPFDPGVVRGGDDGVHRIVAQPDGETAIAFSKVVEEILSSLEKGDIHQVKIT
ncbi:MAG: Mrp/NBP35 family ATP-binding protein [Candidatus Thalassarchaeaceae archaeon]|nr:Mrp/NBP35 family ATP-binding protein [Candidatus Thalassarchaeaceae archaeon]|tara:strand:+ start:2731 stop:3735 length:1005 start_codon:yes stop_codon:yes gene_type:complete